MEKINYNNLLNNYILNSNKICIEKSDGYEFMFILNNNAKLSDMYNYVVDLYTHITDPILLYIDKDYKEMIPNNNILLTTYLCKKKILSCSLLTDPVVYKFYLYVNNKII